MSLSAFGPAAVDGMIKWMEERKKAGDFEITDPQFRLQLKQLLTPPDEGVIFASPEQIKEAFDLRSRNDSLTA